METPETARTRRRDLSVERLVDRATEILRTEGEDALTMRRLAEDCGVTPMAIYHHVDNKQQLVDLVLDRVISTSFEALAGEGTWREVLADFVLGYRRVLIENPGAGRVYVSRPIVNPATARTTEHLFELLARGGVEGAAAAEATDAIVLLIMGSLVNDLTRPPHIRDRLMNQVPAEEAPLMVRNLEAYSHRDPEQRFRLALDWLLDGIETRAGR